MSNTHKDKIRGKLRRAARIKNNINEYLSYYDNLSPDQQKTIVNYNKNPSWYNHIINNVPKKRHDKALCQMIKKVHNAKLDEFFMDDDYIFSDDHKPCAWYW